MKKPILMTKQIAILLLSLASVFGQQTSPCPNVFMYEQSGSESGKWYGVASLSTDSVLHSLWLNVVLDSKADLLGNWIGDVTTSDNMDFKIENSNMKLQPGPATTVRFFVQYNPANKAPKVVAIRLNGREICNVATHIKPNPSQSTKDKTTERTYVESARPDVSYKPQSKPDDYRPQSKPDDYRPQSKPDDYRPQSKPDDYRPQTEQSYRPKPQADSTYQKERPAVEESNANPYSIGGGPIRDQNGQADKVTRPDNSYQITTAKPKPYKPSNSGYDEEDFDESKPADENEYFGGGLVTIIAGPRPNNNHRGHNKPQQQLCGKVVRNANPLVVNGKQTMEGQWPWQIALYQAQTVDNKYICGGTLISAQHIVTAAHCVTIRDSSKPVNKNTLTVYLGKHNLRTSVEGVQIRLVGNIKVHPRYNASSFSNDLSILHLREPTQYTDWVRPACLWPETQVDLSNVVEKLGSVVGWGFDSKGVATEELNLIEMPVVSQEKCIRSFSEFFARFTSEYTYCAGYRDGQVDYGNGTRRSTSVCNGDSGGGMVFNIQGQWYLRGLVSLSVARQTQNVSICDPSHYVVFTDLAKYLSWIKDNMNDY